MIRYALTCQHGHRFESWFGDSQAFEKLRAAQAGRHDDKRETYGHSIIVGPWGEVLAEADGETPQVVLADIDPALAEDARARIPALKNERAFVGPDMPKTLRSVS